MAEITRAPCDHDYPCSCVMYEGDMYRSMGDIVFELERRMAKLTSAAARALERCEVGDDIEAMMILDQVVTLDGKLVD